MSSLFSISCIEARDASWCSVVREEEEENVRVNVMKYIETKRMHMKQGREVLRRFATIYLKY